MNITGACFCGEISYEGVVDAERVGLCHCRDCQIFSGSAFRLSCFAAPESFRFTRGEPRYFDKTADSGNVRRMAFCANCGTHLCSVPTESDPAGGFVSIRLSTSHQFSEMRPGYELYCDSKVGWLAPIEGAVSFPGMPG